MPETLANYLSHRTSLELLRDVADIVVVYYLFYRLLLVARGTRAMQIATGLGIVSLLYVVAQAIGLVTIVALFGALLQSIILVIVVVFQTDIRRALERVGSRAFFGNFARAQESEVIESVVLAAGELARHRLGAIIAFEQDANLDEFIGQNKGITLDARVSRELLVSLFLPDASNKLHDGAVILRNLRVAKAGVFFPMPESRVFDPTFGSRHRAAIGITEETDAVVVVVSEERGTISFCFNGNVASNLQAEQLREMLLSIMSPKVRRKSRQVQRRRTSVSVLPPEVEPRERSPEHDSMPPPPSVARRTSHSAAPPPLRKATPAAPATQTPRAGLVDGTRHGEDDTAVDASLRQSVTSPSRPMPRGQGIELPPDPDEAEDPEEFVDVSGAFLQWLRDAFTENVGLKGMALVFSLGFFGYVHGREDVEQRTIPMSVISLPPEGGDKELMTRVPASVHLTVRGPARAMATLVHDGVTPVEVDLRQGHPQRMQFTRTMFTLPRDIEIVMVDPPYFDLEWEDVVTRQVPLHASLTGQPAEGRIVSGEPKVDPEKVTVRGPTSLVETMQFAALAPYVVTGLTEGNWARRIAISTPPQRVQLLGLPAATVTIEVVRRKSDKLYPGLEVQVIGPAHATVLPRMVDVTVTGSPEAISALHEDQIVPRADLTAAGFFDKDTPHGSATVPVIVELQAIEAQIQPPSVTVKW